MNCENALTEGGLTAENCENEKPKRDGNRSAYHQEIRFSGAGSVAEAGRGIPIVDRVGDFLVLFHASYPSCLGLGRMWVSSLD